MIQETTEFVRFKQLQFSSPDKFDVKKVTKIEAFIPGVNSGMYDKELCIKVVVKEQKTFGVRKTFGEVSLNVAEIRQLRDECNKILALKNT